MFTHREERRVSYSRLSDRPLLLREPLPLPEPPTHTHQSYPSHTATHHPAHTTTQTHMHKCILQHFHTRQGGKASKTAFRHETQTNEFLLSVSSFLKEQWSNTDRWNLDTQIRSSTKSHPSRSAIWHLPGLLLSVVPARLPLALAGKQISEGDLTPVQREGIAGKLELETRLETLRAPSTDACHWYAGSPCTCLICVINTHHWCSSVTSMDMDVNSCTQCTVWACKWIFYIQSIKNCLFDNFHKSHHKKGTETQCLINISAQKCLECSVQLCRMRKQQNPSLFHSQNYLDTTQTMFTTLNHLPENVHTNCHLFNSL